MRKNTRGPTAGKKEPSGEPRVGIFWVLDGKLLIDSTPLSGAEPYGDFKVHPGDHCSVWPRFQQTGAVPAEMEYEEAPRGRVMYNTKLGQYTLLADRCILRRTELVSRIKSELRLPANTTVGTDSHYRCFSCLYGRDDDED
jgi:hypothetical protein